MKDKVPRKLKKNLLRNLTKERFDFLIKNGWREKTISQQELLDIKNQ